MEQAMVFINELANKLGVAVEYLWSTMVHQQYAEGVVLLIMAGVFLMMLIAMAVFGPKFYKYAYERYRYLEKDRKENGTGFDGSYYTSGYEEDRWETLSVFTPLVLIACGIILFILICIFIPNGIQQMINPDYYALQEILNAVKGG